jgi:hypothetical protein
MRTKTNIIFPGLAAFALACFALSPGAQAVSPAPDGGYPGGNTAEGQTALLSLTTGGFNTAVGYLSLRSNTSNSFNTAIGAGALLANTADQNTATGAGALLSNATGAQNTADGAFALFSNTSGTFNTADGFQALYSNITGSYNTAIGVQALYNNTINDSNTANGYQALYSNTTGFQNTANGAFALFNNTTGFANTGNGLETLYNNTTGNSNIALGPLAGASLTTGSNVICIGANVIGANVDNSCFIGNIRDVTTQNADAIPVLIDSAGQLGTASSSRRFKKEIKPMDKASESILALKPVKFQYKSDTKGTPQFGLIAEEVAEVNPDLVVRDKNGEIYTVRYDAVNTMLLNEFLKEHKKVEDYHREAQKQEATIAKQQKQIEGLTTGLQKVSAQLEMSKPAPQMVLNNQ